MSDMAARDDIPGFFVTYILLVFQLEILVFLVRHFLLQSLN